MIPKIIDLTTANNILRNYNKVVEKIENFYYISPINGHVELVLKSQGELLMYLEEIQKNK